MVFEFLNKFVRDTGSTPNSFTIGMGELVRKARLEAKLSQSELAERIYIRQASISEIENGKREVSSSEIIYLSHALNKPITYFFPKVFIHEIEQERLPPAIQELIIQANRLDDDDVRRLVAQARALGDLAEKGK